MLANKKLLISRLSLALSINNMSFTECSWLQKARFCSHLMSPLYSPVTTQSKPIYSHLLWRRASTASDSDSSIGHSSDLFARPRITLSRFVRPGDTQYLGTWVHGGVILSLMEEAGELHGTRYCNQHHTFDGIGRLRQPVAALAQLEKMEYMRPVKSNQLMQIETEVVYTSLRSLRAKVSLYAGDISGHQQLACRSLLWYVPVDVQDNIEVLKVPPLRSVDDQLFHEGQLVYNALKTQRQKLSSCPQLVTSKELLGNSDYTVLPQHCGLQSLCKGGPLMFWMDETAGLIAWKYCGGVLVTISVDSMRFFSTVPLGSVLSVVSRPVFTSRRSIDLYTAVYKQRFDLSSTDTVVYETVADAFFTFAQLDKEQATKDGVRIREVVPVTDEDTVMYEARKKLYSERKASSS